MTGCFKLKWHKGKLVNFSLFKGKTASGGKWKDVSSVLNVCMSNMNIQTSTNSDRIAGSSGSVIWPPWSLCGGSISQVVWENVPRKQVELVFEQKTNCSVMFDQSWETQYLHVRKAHPVTKPPGCILTALNYDDEIIFIDNRQKNKTFKPGLKWWWRHTNMLHNCAHVIILTMNFKRNIFYSDLIIYFKSTFWHKENVDKMFSIHIFSHLKKKRGCDDCTYLCMHIHIVTLFC